VITTYRELVLCIHTVILGFVFPITVMYYDFYLLLADFEEQILPMNALLTSLTLIDLS
jgi:hypothetical protein